ncbi:uncharacterized protein RHIMIDRAFT_294605 [Rhizopus microsporus ATCC 52813]|uniref:Uncharacterized protein n=1 Tax=Rhizopus microsporus ATCC 52813 TaxID=1340429 RepID=A0A2G4SK04_RHIZD|nr:uncharacterized protein RHIMIDRAFT_294605 [Rhizopus microsporus ATCC 52813]PHZ09082.1 hypothetical protein RHIMIDRAFT_294605 [Rhizopus microsporus ATCC 52813]
MHEEYYGKPCGRIDVLAIDVQIDSIMDDDGIDVVSIDSESETKVTENEAGEFEEMASNLD